MEFINASINSKEAAEAATLAKAREKGVRTRWKLLALIQYAFAHSAIVGLSTTRSGLHNHKLIAARRAHPRDRLFPSSMGVLPELSDLKLIELKSMCRAKGLKVSGRKAELIARVLEFEKEADVRKSSASMSSLASSKDVMTESSPAEADTSVYNRLKMENPEKAKKANAEHLKQKTVTKSDLNRHSDKSDLQRRGWKSTLHRSVDVRVVKRKGVTRTDQSKCGLILIAGGGIGGVAVAKALQSKGFEVMVLEKDTNFNSRKQGYGLTMQRASALEGLELALDQEAPSTSHYIFSVEGHILGVFGRTFNQALVQDVGHGRRRGKETRKQNIQIPRQKLRAAILEKLDPETIRWNSTLAGFDCNRKGVTVTLSDGTALDGALLIGADGIFSAVRRQMRLPHDRLNYLGLIVVLGIMETEGMALLQRRIFETVDGTTRIYAMPFTTNVTMWQLSFPMGEKDAREIAKDPIALKEAVVNRCMSWHEPIPDLLRKTPIENIAGYPVYDRKPLDFDILRTAVESSHHRVTLLGDAAHPMSPFKGQGANQALQDSVLLAQTLDDCVSKFGPCLGIDKALPLFEQQMLKRSAKMVASSRDAAKMLHSSSATIPARNNQDQLQAVAPDMIEILRANRVGAHSATDPRGLDAVVADALGMCDLSERLSLQHSRPKTNKGTSKERLPMTHMKPTRYQVATSKPFQKSTSKGARSRSRKKSSG